MSRAARILQFCAVLLAVFSQHRPALAYSTPEDLTTSRGEVFALVTSRFDPLGIEHSYGTEGNSVAPEVKRGEVSGCCSHKNVSERSCENMCGHLRGGMNAMECANGPQADKYIDPSGIEVRGHFEEGASAKGSCHCCVTPPPPLALPEVPISVPVRAAFPAEPRLLNSLIEPEISLFKQERIAREEGRFRVGGGAQFAAGSVALRSRLPAVELLYCSLLL